MKEELAITQREKKSGAELYRMNSHWQVAMMETTSLCLRERRFVCLRAIHEAAKPAGQLRSIFVEWRNSVMQFPEITEQVFSLGGDGAALDD